MSVLTLFLTVAWTIEIVATEKITYPPTIALDSSNNPNILISQHRGYTGPFQLYYLFLYSKINGNWTADTFETNCSEPIYPPDLAIDRRNGIWCIYSAIDSITYVNYLIVAHKDSTGWIKDTVESGGGFISYSITTDNLCIPHIAYDEGEGILWYACYAILTDSGWIKTIIDTTYFGSYTGISIAFRRKPYISYMCFYPDGSGELWYAKKVDSIWFKEMLDNLFADFLLSFSSIAIGPTDFAGIVYLQQHPLGENPIVQYAYYDGLFWHIDTVETLSWFNSQKVLDIDSFVTPYLLYRRLETSDRKDRIAYKDEIGWHTEILPFTPTTTWAWGGSLCISDDNLIHIARYATDYDDSIHEIHCIYGTPEGIEEDAKLKVKSEKLKLEVLPNIVNRRVKLQYAIPEKQKICLGLYDAVGRKVATIADGILEPGVYSYNLNSSHLSSGIYFLILEGEKETKTQKVLVVR